MGDACEEVLIYRINNGKKPEQNVCTGHGTMHRISIVNVKRISIFRANLKVLMCYGY